MKRILPTVSLIVVAACTPDVPAAPSFQQDVMPVLAANCLRCHGAPAIGGAPEEFRLDSFGDVTVRERRLPAGDPACDPPRPSPDCFAVVIGGAASMAPIAAIRVADDERPMPPKFLIDDHQIELLENWAAAGAERGAPRPGNGIPTAAIETNERSGAVVRLRVRVDDPDRDVVGGALFVRIAGTETFVGLVHSGVASVTWDATGVAAGSYPISVRVDDGAAEVVIGLGAITL